MKYCRPREETGYTPADLVMHDGFGRTAIFEILNLTPYNIRYTSALTDQTDLNRLTNKAFAFAPVGVPSVIPSAATGTTEQMSVYLGLWLSRVAPPDPLKSAVIADIFNIVNEVTSLLAFVIDPLNPPGWWAAFSFTYAPVQDPGFLDQQTQPNDGVKMYVSTYPLPTFDRECFQRNNSSAWVNTGNTGTPDQYLACTPGTTVGESSDGCKAQWADTDSGPAPADGGRDARLTRVPSRGGSHAAAAQADHQAGGEVPARPDQAVAAAHPGFAKGGLNHVDATYPRGYAGVGRGIGTPSREPDGPRSVPIGRRAQRRHLHLLQRGADFHDYARQPDGLPAGQ